MSRLIVGPFNRVEGDLEVKLDIEGDQVSSAQVVTPLYRGFENILFGKDPRDALVYAPRICGICSVSQSTAAAYALAQVQGLDVPKNGRLATNTILAAENVADHFTHFYMFFMPDFARPIYASEPWGEDTARRFQALKGEAAAEILPARAEFLHVVGILAGKWPHTLSIQPGGTTKAIAPQEAFRLGAILMQFRKVLERVLFGADLDEIGELNSLAALEKWLDSKSPNHSDFCRFLHISKALGLRSEGNAGDRFMSYGAYDQKDGKLFSAGVYEGGKLRDVDAALIAEDVSHAWMKQDEPRHPAVGVTKPDGDMADGYTWCKAPRLGGQTMEVGALARQAVSGHPLIRDVVSKSGGNVENRILARLLEIALLVPAMQNWVKEFELGEPFRIHGEGFPDSRGVGMIEAARGSLGHWLHVENEKIANYQIIAPTTWNFSPRDENNVPGPLEQALVGARIRSGETDPVSVQHIVRSFDPCMVCTVH